MSKSRLHRKLKAEKSLFEFSLGSDKTFSDNQITRISINRGQSGFIYGVQPSTLEVEVVEPLATMFNRHASIRLSAYAQEKISKITGVSAVRLADRFHGNVGIQETEDNGTGRSRTTVISASSYSSLLKQMSKKIKVYNGQTVNQVLFNAFNINTLKGEIKLHNINPSLEYWDRTNIPESPVEMSFSEIISTYAADFMVLCTERRDGRIHIRPLLQRHAEVLDRVSKDFAPLRSSTPSPAHYVQPIDSRTTGHIQVEAMPDGTTRRRTWEAFAPDYVPNIPLETSEVDQTAVVRSTGTNDAVLRALQFQSNWPRLNLSKIKLDILALLSSKSDYNRKLAGTILTLEHGDPVYFSYDWTFANAGTLIAQQITETITPTGWTIEIDFEHPTNLLGMSGYPTAPPRIWSQAVQPWDESAQKWNEV